jgi:hypothetical protein
MMDSIFLKQLKNPIFQLLNIEKIFLENKIEDLISDETFELIIENELR